MRLWLVIAAAIVSFITTARAQVEVECKPIIGSIEKLQDDSTLLYVRILDGKKRDIAATVYNDIPPQSDIPWASAWLAYRNDGYAVLMVGFESFVCGHMMLGPEELGRFLKEIDGQAI
jgi:hypothetical protein